MSNQTLAVYTAANDPYVPKAVMALRSFQRWHPEYDYFLFGTQAVMRPKSLQLIQQYNIEIINVDEAHRFERSQHYYYPYPVETVIKLMGPELLAERGFLYSMGIDGDVFSARPLELDSLLAGIEGFAGRVVGDLAGKLYEKQRGHFKEFDFSQDLVYETLGIDDTALSTNYEVNGGVLFWNNTYMAKLGLFDKVIQIFNLCRGYFEGGQDLMTFVSAAHNIPFMELGDPYNFNFFEESFRYDASLRKKIRNGQYDDIYIVHFVWCKPWLKQTQISPEKRHFINTWRRFIVDELGENAYGLFDDLSIIKSVSFEYRLRGRVLRSLLSFLADWKYRALLAWKTVYGKPLSAWPRLPMKLWVEREENLLKYNSERSFHIEEGK